jgi:hypothetical protein
VDKTLAPDPEYLPENTAVGIGGFDDGARINIWLRQAPELVNAPVLGTGYFHRGGRSGIWPTGSHNHWIQMFLETGLIGGTLTLLILLRLWRHTNHAAVRAAGYDVAMKAVLVTTFVAGMTGEYFYGGLSVFTLFVVYGPSGAFPVRASATYKAPAKPLVTRYTSEHR